MRKKYKKRLIILGSILFLTGVWFIAKSLVDNAIDREEKKQIQEYQEAQKIIDELAEQKNAKLNKIYHMDIEDDTERSIQFVKDWLDVDGSPYKDATFELSTKTYSNGTIDIIVQKGNFYVNANCYEGSNPDKFWKYEEFSEEENEFFESLGRYTYIEDYGIYSWEVVYE